MVLFLRESLFRLCELSINTDLDANNAQDLYKTVINAALELVKKEQAQIELEQERLKSADQAQFIWEYLNEKKLILKSFKVYLKNCHKNSATI